MSFERSNGFRSQDNVRMAGFLEKKGKMKLMTHWKKYWFVLEERLLLYYRSEIEYTNLSPCRGSLNMGLVTTVRPGSSTGPCIIHVITRTQDVQLKAKNRATQEKWLEALLHSMSLPIVAKPIKPRVQKNKFLGYGSSLDNVAFNVQHPPGCFESEWTLPRKLDYRKRQISGSIYGGSLDTAVWSTRVKPVRTSSPSTTKAKLLEKFLKISRESETLNSVTSRPKNSRLSLCDEEEMKFVGEEMEEIREKKIRCKVHDENRNHDLYSVVDKTKKKMKKTLSDTEINKTADDYHSLCSNKTERKDDSPFDRLKSALTKIPKDNILKGKPDTEKRNKTTKKRRQSFLQKVLKKKNYEHRDCESDSSDPLYDTIQHLQEEPHSSIPEFTKESSPEIKEETAKSVDSLYAEVQKIAVGSKTILPPNTMSELKLKLKSRESLNEEIKTVEIAPTLPPRRMSRPISPWHDVPTNNAPVGDTKSFYVHQAIVKFNDNIPQIDLPKSDNDFSDIENDLRFDVIESRGEFLESSTQENKNDDLSTLLEQLTKITVAPLAEPELTDDYNSSSESEKLWPKNAHQEPDYDIPRPHRPMSIVISEEKFIISSTEFMGRNDNNSDTGSSFRSMEPDSLESTDKKT